VNNKNDNTLVKEVLWGNHNAFRTLIERHQGKIYYLGLKFFRNAEDAEDFSQDVFIRVYDKLKTFKGEVSFSGWLYKLAFNLAVNAYRVKRLTMSPLESHGEIEDSAVTPESAALEHETQNIVQKLIASLPRSYHIAIKMHYFDGLSYPEIAEITEIPVNTIKSHIRRAKELISSGLKRLSLHSPFKRGVIHNE
jgi:RNA polymerase sigma-70 factor, ECF subfamily